MISQRIAESIKKEFPHQLTSQQAEAVVQMGEFLADPRNDQAFVLRGYAGTGKTSLVAAIVRLWKRIGRPVILLAPTGRAAKVFSLYADLPAFTIHKAIYRQETFNGEDTRFQRGWNGQKETLFIVDEASMIANQVNNPMFGTGSLLEDLIQFVFTGTNCKLILVGDTAQLPPVGESESPALSPKFIEGYGLYVRSFQLTEVVRQNETSSVLHNATLLRQYIEKQELAFEILETTLPPLIVSEQGEVNVVMGNELIETLETSYRNWGIDETIVITRSNKRANIYNNGIRSRIFEYEEILNRGDLIMIVKNNYYWTQIATTELSDGETLPMTFIANGDTAEVVRLRNVHEMHGFQFADATLRFSDYNDYEMTCRVLLDTLQAEAPALTSEQSTRLYEAVYADYADISNKKERMKAIRQDAYYNALQIKYAYAVTCHKAQGGQWHEVYIDQGFLPPDIEQVSYLRWLYTAITRTSSQLYLVNWPAQQIIHHETTN